MNLTQKKYIIMGGGISLVCFAIAIAMGYHALTYINLSKKQPRQAIITSVSHLTKVHYIYQYNGITYSNTSFFNKEKITEIEPNKTVSVYYASESPKFSTLSGAQDYYNYLILAILCFILGFFFAALSLWGIWRCKQEPSLGYGIRLTLFMETFFFLMICVNLYLCLSRTILSRNLDNIRDNGIEINGYVLDNGWERKSISYKYNYKGTNYKGEQVIINNKLYSKIYIGKQIKLKINPEKPELSYVVNNLGIIKYLKNKTIINIIYVIILLFIGLLFLLGYYMQKTLCATLSAQMNT